jgi:hypothetical protein
MIHASPGRRQCSCILRENEKQYTSYRYCTYCSEQSRAPSAPALSENRFETGNSATFAEQLALITPAAYSLYQKCWSPRGRRPLAINPSSKRAQPAYRLYYLQQRGITSCKFVDQSVQQVGSSYLSLSIPYQYV